jgi:hypothetical protein
MTTSWKPHRGTKRYERAGSVVLNSVKLGQAPISLNKIRWRHRWLWILLALAAVVGALVLWLTVDSRFYVYDAQIDGTRRLSTEQVFDASGLRGLHILWARPAAIESQILESLPSLESVEASCQLPSKCSIAVVERRPRVLWEDSGQRSWIDDQGTVFDAQDAAADVGYLGEDAGQWSVTGPLPLEEEGHLDPSVRVALEELWQSERDLPGIFQYSPAQGLSFVDENGWRVVVGEGSGMARRLQVLDGLVAHLKAAQVTPRFVDVRFPEAPYYAPRAE